MRSFAYLCSSLAIVLSGSLAPSAPAAAALPSYGPIGAYISQSTSPLDWDNLEHQPLAGNVFETDISWDGTISSAWIQSIDDIGSTPFIGITCPVAGCPDAVAQTAAHLAGPIGMNRVYVAWDPEANNPFVYSGDPSTYKRQFQELVTDLAKDGALNVIPVWQVSAKYASNYDAFWPGSSYVDKIGIDMFPQSGDTNPITTTSCPDAGGTTEPHCLPDAVYAAEHGTIGAPSSTIFIASAATQTNQCATYADLNSFSTNYGLAENFIYFDRNAYTLSIYCTP